MEVRHPDAQAVAAAAVQPEPAPAEQPSCAICIEPYSAASGVVPRMLHCVHAFCEGCLGRIGCCGATTPIAQNHGVNVLLERTRAPASVREWDAGLAGRPLRASGGGKRLECPMCRKACAVKGGQAGGGAATPLCTTCRGRRISG